MVLFFFFFIVYFWKWFSLHWKWHSGAMILDIKVCWTTGDEQSLNAFGPLGGGSPVWELKTHKWRICWLATETEAQRRGGSFVGGRWAEGNVFTRTSPFLLLVNQLHGSSLH